MKWFRDYWRKWIEVAPLSRTMMEIQRDYELLNKTKEGEKEMRETGMVVECESRKHKFLLGLTDDGFRECPICSKELLNPRESFSANEIYGMKTIGQAWREKRKAESNTKPKQSISIAVDADTNKLQLKLRAIAKHANQLADELEAIDNEWQCDCGSINYTDYISDRFIRRECDKCGEQYAIPNDDLPTRLEGSE